MAELKTVDLPLLDERGRTRGVLTITTLPGQKPGIIQAEENVAEDELENVRLFEGREYVYAIRCPENEGPFDTDHPEMFVADTERGDRGRLRTGLYTGTVDVQIFAASRAIGKISFEVQATKLSYLRDYHWMLRDIADVCTELVMDRFAPATTRFAVDDRGDAETLYQRFAFLHSMLEGDEFRAAMRHILTSPHVTWENVDELTWPARGVRPSSRVARNLALPGPRAVSALLMWGALESVPQKMVVSRALTSVDNVPNRFIKWLLREWLCLMGQVSEVLDKHREKSGFVRRGKREINSAIKTLEGFLDDDLFRDVGELKLFPEANQVLQKREGYRYLFRMHLQFEAAARLHWPGLDPVYRAGQRNVAKLYEYWVYLQIGRIVARLCGQTFDARRLVEKSPDGLTLRLRSREETMVSGTFDRLGRTLNLESWFNKSFGPSFTGREGSWTRPLRPDCSLRVEVKSNSLAPLVTWIHFDAKYRLEQVEEVFSGAEDDEMENLGQSRHRREDLLKMHAYKDGIRKSAGAYIIYPGSEAVTPYRQFHELLPGLGAFALRPAKTGESSGAENLAVFMEHVLTHLATQATQDARVRYWTERAHTEHPVDVVLPAAPFLKEPPADVLVLLGWAKNAAHREWIQTTGLYNLRADPRRGGAVGIDGRELQARFLVVFGEDQLDVDIHEIIDAPRVLTDWQLRELDYPEPRGHHYLCLTLKTLAKDATSKWLTRMLVEEVRTRTNPHARHGAPVLVTWLDLCAGVQFVERRI